ncbi:hypothetical protein KC365_g127 [Hortaea werneckii]|nr:hypothetical protein KC339_g123 [Hortaea werneckii]KAI7245868.1 hypothetical protein KC365_g127 [Hortaea werneckii]
MEAPAEGRASSAGTSMATLHPVSVSLCTPRRRWRARTGCSRALHFQAFADGSTTKKFHLITGPSFDTRFLSVCVDDYNSSWHPWSATKSVVEGNAAFPQS